MPRENATETGREFDAENRMLAIVEHAPDAGRRSPLSQIDYVYDEVGNRLATLTTLDPDGRGAPEDLLDTYRYDETYQVTGADYAAEVKGRHVGPPAATVRFTYDAVGNRLRVDENGAVTRYAVNNLNQYVQVGEFSPTHDRNGNLSGMGRWLYRYDALSRLVFATDGVTTAQFWYDAKNRCVARRYQSLSPSPSLSPSLSTLTLNTYDNWNLIEERDASGAQTARYVHGRRIDEIVAIVNRHGTFYPHHDVLGNVTMLTDANGGLAERYTYSVTGQVTISDASGKTLSESAVGNRWMFTGREWLSEVGLYDYRNRVYSAELGRFLQTDPIRFAAGDVNIYRYVENRMLALTDPEGLAAGGVRVNGTATFFGGVEITIGAYWDNQGGFDVLVGIGGAAALPTPGASATIGYTITNAASVEDLRGWGYSAGVNAAAGAAVEKNYVWGENYVGTDAGLGIGTPGHGCPVKA